MPTITWSQTTPLICTVGNAAAETVSGTDGSAGAVSAAAGVMPTFSAMNAKFALIRTTASDAAANFPTRPPKRMRAVLPDLLALECPAPDFHVTISALNTRARQREVPPNLEPLNPHRSSTMGYGSGSDFGVYRFGRQKSHGFLKFAGFLPTPHPRSCARPDWC